MQSIYRPDGDATLENAVEAIRPSFDGLVELADVSIEAAALPEIPGAFVALARRAESVGWTFDVAQGAVRQLAHEYPVHGVHLPTRASGDGAFANNHKRRVLSVVK